MKKGFLWAYAVWNPYINSILAFYIPKAVSETMRGLQIWFISAVICTGTRFDQVQFLFFFLIKCWIHFKPSWICVRRASHIESDSDCRMWSYCVTTNVSQNNPCVNGLEEGVTFTDTSLKSFSNILRNAFKLSALWSLLHAYLLAAFRITLSSRHFYCCEVLIYVLAVKVAKRRLFYRQEYSVDSAFFVQQFPLCSLIALVS